MLRFQYTMTGVPKEVPIHSFDFLLLLFVTVTVIHLIDIFGQ